MSDTFQRIARLIQVGEVKISEHGYDELASDGLFAGEILTGATAGVVLEDYPAYPKGPCVLVFQTGSNGEPVHVVWGIPKGYDTPAVLVTAYRPNPDDWEDDFKRRRQ